MSVPPCVPSARWSPEPELPPLPALPAGPAPRLAPGRALAAALLAAAALCWVAASPRAAGPGEAVTDAERLARARAEARDNCLVAGLLAAGVSVAPPWFDTRALQAALDTDLVAGGDLGEVATLRREARWLVRLASPADLEARSFEDLAFLTGGIHHYLDAVAAEADGGAGGPPHEKAAAAYDRARLCLYRGMDFDDLLGTWD